METEQTLLSDLSIAVSTIIALSSPQKNADGTEAHSAFNTISCTNSHVVTAVNNLLLAYPAYAYICHLASRFFIANFLFVINHLLPSHFILFRIENIFLYGFKKGIFD